MATKIVIPNWMKREEPSKADFCDLVNYALEGNPTMTLEEFAQLISQRNVERTIERMERVEEKQFKEN